MTQRWSGRRYKPLLLTAAAALLTGVFLSAAPAQARYIREVSWQGVYAAAAPQAVSNCLAAGGQSVLLEDWRPDSPEQKILPIEITADGVLSGPITCESSQPRYLEARLSLQSLEMTAGESRTVELILLPTDAARQLTQPTTATVRVAWRTNAGGMEMSADFFVNLLPLAPEEKITAMIRVSEFEDDRYLCMVTRAGIIKRTRLNAYSNARKNGLIAIDLDDGDELAWVSVTDGATELLVATKKGMAIRFNETDVRAVGRTARGVKAISLRDGDNVVGLSPVSRETMVLTVSETGYGRLSEIDDYRLQMRGGKGITNYHVEKYGDVASIKLVSSDEDIILISESGIIIRIKADTIRVCSRPSKGVRVMKIADNNRIVAVASVPHEDDVEDISSEDVVEDAAKEDSSDD